MSSLIQPNKQQSDVVEAVDSSPLNINQNTHQLDDKNENKTDDTSNIRCTNQNRRLFRRSNSNWQQEQQQNYRHSRFMIKMLNLCKEVIVMILIAIAYAALVNEQPSKISRSPSAYPFFSNNSIIKDWYRGEITKAIEQARKTDIAFVMFYAPWSAESQQIRNEFELTANYLYKQIEFIAINCWQPGSECQKQYNKVYKWPILIAYPINNNGIQYNGPYKHYYMIKFLQNIYKPLVIPNNVNDLIVRHDAVVLANIDCLPGSREFSIYYQASLKFLERDPFREIIFAIMPQKRSNNNTTTKQLHLYLWNETISFNNNKNNKWDSEIILNWILRNLHQITGWVSPSGTKSLSLSNYIQPGPALILFTPRNPFLEQMDYYSVLKELAFDYYNCANDNTIKLKRRLIYLERLKSRVNYAKLYKKCFGNNKLMSTNPIKNTSSCGNCYNSKQICQSEQIDYRSTEKLHEFYEQEECRNFHLSEKYQPIIISNDNNTNKYDIDNFTDNNVNNITGLACKQNRSLVLIAMDSLRYYHFAEKLGIDLFKKKDKTGIVIVDDSMETHYIMNTDFSQQNLLNFIKNYTSNRLKRALNSTTLIKSKNTHVYKQFKSSSTASIDIRELNTDNFLSTIHQSNRAFIIFYYTKQCAFCSGISHIILILAQLLRTIKQIEFVRIDGDLNLLPWEYTMESYPTVLLIPTIKKSESRVFPKSIPITVPNLLNFLLVNLEPELKLQIMWTICNQSKYKDSNSDCMVALRMETLSVIDNTLRMWRLFDRRRRPEILYKLQLLKHLHLLFAHQTNKLSLINNYFNKLEFFKRIQHDEL